MPDMQSTQVTRHIDLESLLWDMRDIIRSLGQVNKTQAAEIERLGGAPWQGAFELQERVNGAIASCDIALAEWESDTQSSFGGRVDVAAWLETTRQLAAEEADADAGDHTGDLSFVSASSSFWKPSGFNWADEPATDDEENSMKPVPDLLHDFDDSHSDTVSESEKSFFLTPELLVHGRHRTRREEEDDEQHESDAGETVYDVEDVAIRPARRYSFSDAVHNSVELITAEGTQKILEDTEPIKSNSIPFPRLPTAADRLRRLARMESLPNLVPLPAMVM